MLTSGNVCQLACVNRNYRPNKTDVFSDFFKNVQTRVNYINLIPRDRLGNLNRLEINLDYSYP